jgi:hypothetical protein
MRQAPAVEFREVMRGAFASGATDPIAGSRDGARAGTTLTLQAIASIADVPAFVRDPEHAGSLAGRVTFSAVGAERAECHGTFRLFAPSGHPDLKLMVYRAGFEAAGKPYCLDGAKHVGQRSVLGAWSETTTLYCRLHEGADPSGRVIAAGVLRLGPFAFARQLASFRTPNASGAIGGLRALAGFLRFFSGEIIESYLVPRRPG